MSITKLKTGNFCFGLTVQWEEVILSIGYYQIWLEW